MAGIERASVTASFDVGDADAAVLRIEEDTPIEGTPSAPYGSAWVRVWSTAGRPTVTSTSGNVVQLNNTAVGLTATETVMFTNDDTTRLLRPNVVVSSVVAVGLFLNAKAVPIPIPNFVIDPNLGEIRASEKCFGAVSVTYSTVYARYECAFAKDPNATRGDPASTPPKPPSDSEFSPMIIVAARGAKVESVTLRPPPWENEDGSSRIGDLDKDEGAPNGNLVIEIAEAVALDGYVTEKGIGATCTVWVYFGGGLSSMPTVSSGSIKDITGLPTYRNTPDIVNEQVNWANASSVNTKYLPSSLGVEVTASSSGFISAHEGAITPSFLTGVGQKVQAKIYTGNGFYRHGEERELRLGEITLVDSFRLAISGTGSAFASYRTLRREYRVQWNTVGDWFPPVTVSVIAGGRSGSFVIPSPPRKGNK